jgi:hypothetical protein
MGSAWKMMVGPALLMGMKALHIDYDVPRNLLLIRVLYALSQLALFAALFLIHQRINLHGDQRRTVKVKPNGSTVEEEMTYKDYDMSELLKLVKSFGMGAIVTIGIHVYMNVVPALLLQMVTQPITLYDHALFSLYILKKDASNDEKLKRPFPNDSPMAKFEAMKKELAAEEEKRQKKKNDDDEDEPTPAIEDSATTTSHEPVSRAERRPRVRDESD